LHSYLTSFNELENFDFHSVFDDLFDIQRQLKEIFEGRSPQEEIKDEDDDIDGEGYEDEEDLTDDMTYMTLSKNSRDYY